MRTAAAVRTQMRNRKIASRLEAIAGLLKTARIPHHIRQRHGGGGLHPGSARDPSGTRTGPPYGTLGQPLP